MLYRVDMIACCFLLLWHGDLGVIARAGPDVASLTKQCCGDFSMSECEGE